MKVVGINGSARKDGNTALIISKVFDELNKACIETKLIQLADYDIQPCRGCFGCKGRGNCVLAGDGFAEAFSSLV
ncbi:MAG: flavodoxin family protein, partial [Muribaculaceae bacterium]|nr:flavodoxin family protein [Muribaculaceae bacterium]